MSKLQRVVTRDDVPAEKRIQDQGATYTRAWVPIDMIDVEASKTNLGRMGRQIYDETVLTYAIAMLTGAAFPAVVLVKMINGMYLILGGVHRVLAVIQAEFPVQEIDAYVLDAYDVKVNAFLMALLNRDNGHPEKLGSELEAARILQETFRLSVKDVAKDFHIKENVLNKYIQHTRTKARLTAAGCSTELPKDTIEALHSVKNATRFALFGRLFTDFQISGEDASRFVRDVRDLSDLEAEQRVAAYRIQLAKLCKAKQGSVTTTSAPRAVSAVAVRARLFRQMQALSDTLTAKDAAACQITNEEHLEDVHARFTVIYTRFVTLFGVPRAGGPASKGGGHAANHAAGGNGVANGDPGLAAAKGAAAARGRRTTHVR